MWIKNPWASCFGDPIFNAFVLVQVYILLISNFLFRECSLMLKEGAKANLNELFCCCWKQLVLSVLC